ncbi:CocE/NonD family hydrolase [Lacihabitans soyangensis]|uniref:CocE/NonD family hydrolase n=1 Tax=Lacihabitans soyangensis TaxID=869394 RepID=A0AAE3H723_9BACT|nr:CocE/NonD family hydrolase [Lacihabitans soyangensis]MCP9765612.1 CocE/NonD family hydrolase [Lacihabitans soyangensis]
MRYFFKIITFLLISHVAWAQQPTAVDSIYSIQDSVLIPTKSGVDISAVIIRKKMNTQPLPAILFYTTYYQGANDFNFGKRSAERDYVGIVAYARGIKTDLKNYSPYENECTDIYDIIDWISKQPWCDGKVGMFGGSYTGFSQWATVKNTHPALKTIVPQVAVMPGFDVPMENNVQSNIGLVWPYENIYKSQPISRSMVFEWFEEGSSFRKLDSLVGIPNPIFQKWLEHPSYDSYWKSMVPNQQDYEKINIPVLSTTGYYDGAQIAALEYFKLHNKYNKSANHYIVIGPYDHRGGQNRASKNLMGYEIDNVANVSMRELAYDWLDWILKDKPKPNLLKDKVNFQVMGTNEWRHKPNLRAINNDTLALYLDRTSLVSKRPKKKAFENQIVDFKDRESENNFFIPNIIFDSLEASNGLLFSTEPFQKEFEINGSFTGNLFATINKKDIDVSLALFELMPDGKYFYLTRYIGRASYAKNNSKRQLLKANKKENIPFEITRFVSKKISKGSRLVILLNINKHPFEIINYGSGKEVVDETIKDAGEPLQIKWHNDSVIKIPIWKN